MRSIKKTMELELIPALVSNIMRLYDEELVASELPEDPARPSVARAAFEASVRSSLLSSLRVSGNEFFLSAGDRKQFGYDKHTLGTLKSGIGRNPDPLDWLVFYLEGFIGNFIFVSEATYRKLIAAGKVPPGNADKFKQWGWYGQGFLIPEESWKARGFDTVPGISAHKHPFSGRPPVQIFERALEGINLGLYIDRAIKQALRE